MIDLFETPEVLPDEVLVIIGKFEKSENDYKDCQKLVKRLNAVGYTCEFGLDAIPFNLQKIDESKIYNDLQRQNLEKCIIEVRSVLQFHEISKVHAKAIFNNNGKVYGFTPDGMKLFEILDEFADFDAYYID